MTKQALVLTGGSVRGAFQAGAVRRLFENGYQPEIIRGISAGALNAAYITNQIGIYRNLTDKWHSNMSRKAYKDTGRFLTEMWEKNITSYKSIIEKQYLKGAISAIFGNFSGFANNDPLKKLLNSLIKDRYLKDSGIDLSIGIVDIKSGEMEYINQNNPDILKYVIASSAIPIVMPISKINGNSFCDGGVRDSAPLRSAIDAGAEEITIISCAPLDMIYKDIDTGNILDVTERVLSIVMNESLINDINNVKRVNESKKRFEKAFGKNSNHSFSSKRDIKITLIAPDKSIPVKLTKFDRKDISDMINLGYNTASKYK